MKFSDVLDMLTRRDHSSKVETRQLSDLSASITPPPSALDLYISSAPSPQNALDIFQGAWSSALPEPFSHLKTGTALLFNDPRIHWLIDMIGGVNNKSILELGPLEGGHTYMFEKAGAPSILAIESNTNAFLKSLIIKELFELKYARFLCGDFMEFLREENTQKFQIGLASGVLYHMQNPVELIALLTHRCLEHLFFWTHYYDETIISANPNLSPKFNDVSQVNMMVFSIRSIDKNISQHLSGTAFVGEMLQLVPG
jgi:hypothetical protein